MVTLFMGPSGSGKDTQADLLAEYTGVEVISTGRLLRALAEGEEKIHRFMKQSFLDGFSNDELVFGVLNLYFKYNDQDSYFLTGAVRRASQIELFDKALNENGMQLDLVFYISLSDEEAIERLTKRAEMMKTDEKVEKRDDDTPEGIRNRLVDYHKGSDEIIQRYRERGILAEVNGERAIEEIQSEIRERYEQRVGDAN